MFKLVISDFRRIFILMVAQITAIIFLSVISPSDPGILLLDVFVISGAIFLTYEHALLFFIVSLPFMPIIPFVSDSFSAWRLFMFILAVRFIYSQKKRIYGFFREISYKKIKDRLWNLSSFNKSLLFFTLFLILSALNARYVAAAIKQIIFYTNAAVFGYLVYYYIETRTNFYKIVFAFLVSIGEIIAVGIFQFYMASVWPLFNVWQYWASNVIPIFYGKKLAFLLSYSNTWFSYFEDSSAGLRMFSVFPDSHSVALYLIFGLSLCGFVLYEAISRKKNYRVKLLLFVLILLGIVLSGSRGAWLGILGPTIIFAAFLFFKKGSRTVPIFMLSIVLVFVLLFPISSEIVSYAQKTEDSNAKSSHDIFLKRIFSITDTNEESNKGRIEIWKETTFFVKDNPLLGVGPGNFPLVLNEDISNAKKGASAHNLYLEILSENGIFGFIFFIVALLSLFYSIYKLCFEVRLSEYRMYGFFAAFSFIWAFSYGLFDVVLLNDKVLIIFCALTAVIYALNKKIDIHYHRAIYSD